MFDSESEPPFAGIDDPMLCLELGEAVLFAVTNTSYPIYDRNNLWNTNPAFDFGLFRQLNESQEVSGDSLLFLFRFNESGFFTFHLNNDPNRRIYIRVVELTAQCPEIGPFFPTTPSQAVQFGVVRKDDILRTPNWFFIGGIILGCLVLTVLVVVALVRGRGKRRVEL